ncbi:MAG: hypothetical protein HRF48_13140 [Chloroflexota bacterium]|jgi:hypothetical protein
MERERTGDVKPDCRAQIAMLSWLIHADPGAPVNYLLRGEEWLACGQVHNARKDFARARALAAQAYEGSAWGYIYQSYIDRADAGLRQCGGAASGS